MPESCLYEIADNIMPKTMSDIDEALQSKFSAAMAKVERPLAKRFEIWEDDRASNSYRMTLHFRDVSEYPFAIKVKKMRGDPAKPPNDVYLTEESPGGSQNAFSMSQSGDQITVSRDFPQESTFEGVEANAGDSTVLTAGSKVISREPPQLSLRIADEPFRGGSLDLETPDRVLRKEEIKDAKMEIRFEDGSHRRGVSVSGPSEYANPRSYSAELDLAHDSEASTNFTIGAASYDASDLSANTGQPGNIGRSFTFSRVTRSA
jgi:hypothetical protein